MEKQYHFPRREANGIENRNGKKKNCCSRLTVLNFENAKPMPFNKHCLFQKFSKHLLSKHKY